MKKTFDTISDNCDNEAYNCDSYLRNGNCLDKGIKEIPKSTDFVICEQVIPDSDVPLFRYTFTRKLLNTCAIE